MDDVYKILKEASKLDDRSVARKIRVAALKSMIKTAEPGILQYPHRTPLEFKTREHVLSGRGGEPVDRDKLYELGREHKKSDLSVDHVTPSLSTRYSPDHVGVMAQRVGEGMFQDPITNKVYDWYEGFKTEDGEEYEGSDVSLQTDIL